MKTLIAVDDSESSWDAVMFAADLLGPEDEATVVNVMARLDPVLVPAGGLPAFAAGGHPGVVISPTDVGAASAEVADRIEDRSEAIAARLAAPVSADSAVVVGSPAERICDLAGELAVDLVIVGTRDPGWFDRIFAGGSVSRDVVDKAPCSVLVVR